MQKTFCGRCEKAIDGGKLTWQKYCKHCDKPVDTRFHCPECHEPLSFDPRDKGAGQITTRAYCDYCSEELPSEPIKLRPPEATRKRLLGIPLPQRPYFVAPELHGVDGHSDLNCCTNCMIRLLQEAKQNEDK